MRSDVVAAARAALIGHRWQGTVTDPETGAQASYSWYCDNVLWDGFSPTLRVVLNNGAGGWKEFASDESGLASVFVTVDAGLQAGALSDLVASRWQDLVGEEL